MGKNLKATQFAASDHDLLLMCDKLLEVIYPSEPLTKEEVSKRVQAIKDGHK